MKIEAVADARVVGGDDEGLGIDNEADVADKSFVENFIDGFGVIFAAVGQTTHSGALGWSDGSHGMSVKRAAEGGKCQSGRIEEEEEARKTRAGGEQANRAPLLAHFVFRGKQDALRTSTDVANRKG